MYQTDLWKLPQNCVCGCDVMAASLGPRSVMPWFRRNGSTNYWQTVYEIVDFLLHIYYNKLPLLQTATTTTTTTTVLLLLLLHNFRFLLNQPIFWLLLQARLLPMKNLLDCWCKRAFAVQMYNQQPTNSVKADKGISAEEILRSYRLFNC